jgi:3-hydroxyacyl-CoA dehydrogenase
MKRNISKVAVLGSGIMGSGIACHFANIGVEVLLLDICPSELNESEKQKNLSLDSKAVKNRIVNEMFNKCIKSKPSPIYSKNLIKRIKLGNFDDDISKIKSADWIIEVVVEKLEIKQKVFDLIEKHRTPGTIVTSNTSGIPIKLMSKGRSDDFNKNFAITHFFNPPRYLNLFEVIPSPNCDKHLLSFLLKYGEKYLGKTSILAKDTPAFIGNRIGTFGIQSLFHQVKNGDYTIEEIDKLTGSIIGRPKSATFRTADVVGLDTLISVSKGIYDSCKNDESIEIFKEPDFLKKMVKNNALGSKTGKGFYKKIKDNSGKSKILRLDFDSMEYVEQKKVNFDILSKARKIKASNEKFKFLVSGDDKGSNFYKENFSRMFHYIQNRIPEISDSIVSIDEAMKAGFGWKDGPFEIWNYIGINEGKELMKVYGLETDKWIDDMLSNGYNEFYKESEGIVQYYDLKSKKYKAKPGQEGFVILKNILEDKVVWSNSEATLYDIGSDIVNLEFSSKMNVINQNIISSLKKGVEIAEKDFKGLVIGNEGSHFSAGADISMIFLLSVEQEYDELNHVMKIFQDTMMRLRYSAIPVVAAPHGYTLGGGCELCLQCDAVVPYSETYIGLVEAGIGLLPGGGGMKEMILRASDKFKKNDVEVNILQEYFMNIGMGKTATSGFEGYELDYFIKGRDITVMNKKNQINIAKQKALNLFDAGYTKPIERNDIKVLGKQALGMLYVGVDSLRAGDYISDHDKKIANKIAYVLCGGDLSQPTKVSEQYLLELEREAFISLCGERKTLERMQYMLKNGKPLRN